MSYAYAVAVFLAGEIVGLFIFWVVKKHLAQEEKTRVIDGAAAKGWLERLALFTGLLWGFPQIVIAFAALKLGTRLHEEQDRKISNSYFLTGNLLSILLAMLYAIATQEIWTACL